MKDANKMSAQELRNEVKLLRNSLRDVNNTFIYTEPGKVRSPQMCYRGHLPYVPMDRWVRCHIIDGLVLLGPTPTRQGPT